MPGRRYACSNCMRTDLSTHRFGPAGILYSYTKVHVSPSSQEPYILGYVDLDEGVRVLAIVDGEFDDLHCDQPVELALVPSGDWAVRPRTRLAAMSANHHGVEK
nr:OB-fold domain-containing protein [Ornithinimicrobium sp. HY1745]